MAVKLRLMRMGKKKQPTYRVVAADSRSQRDGRFLEILGTYAPRAEPSAVRIDNSKAQWWLSRGAQPTEAVDKLLRIAGVFEPSETTSVNQQQARPSRPGAPEEEPVVPSQEPPRAAAEGPEPAP